MPCKPAKLCQQRKLSQSPPGSVMGDVFVSLKIQSDWTTLFIHSWGISDLNLEFYSLTWDIFFQTQPVSPVKSCLSLWNGFPCMDSASLTRIMLGFLMKAQWQCLREKNLRCKVVVHSSLAPEKELCWVKSSVSIFKTSVNMDNGVSGFQIKVFSFNFCHKSM